MARATEWRRVAQSFVGGVQATDHAARGPAIFAGETVTRVHFNYQCAAFPAQGLAPWANCLLAGVWLQNNLLTDPQLDPWTDAGSEQWMWWENAPWRNEVYWKPDAQEQPTELDSAPADGGYRDIKAQRLCTSDGAMWIRTKGEPGGGNQTNHWLSFAMSVLVLLPA